MTARTAIQILGVLLLAAVSHAQAALYSSIYVFGDSNSDSGRRLALEGIPAAPYYYGRHSNGPTAVEVMAGDLGLNNPGTFTNYAVGGALSGFGNVDSNPAVANTGLLDQFNTFKQANATALSSSLYFIWGGDNDLNSCVPNCTPAQIFQIVSNVHTLVHDLYGLGARHFMVIGSYGSGNNRRDYRNDLSTDMAALDLQLSDADILYFSARTTLLDMISSGNPYGFTHTSFSDPCYTGDFFFGIPGVVCAAPNAYVAWDSRGHLTAHANDVLGNAMFAALPTLPASVPEPGSLVLLASGLLGLGKFGRKIKQRT